MNTATPLGARGRSVIGGGKECSVRTVVQRTPGRASGAPSEVFSGDRSLTRMGPRTELNCGGKVWALEGTGASSYGFRRDFVPSFLRPLYSYCSQNSICRAPLICSHACSALLPPSRTRPFACSTFVYGLQRGFVPSFLRPLYPHCNVIDSQNSICRAPLICSHACSALLPPSPTRPFACSTFV